MKNTYIVFDLDGTLVNSLPGIAVGVNKALASMGREPHATSAIRSMIGQGVRHLAACALGYNDEASAPADEMEAFLRAFRQEYAESWQGEGTIPYPGITEMLTRLVSIGAHLAVLTNKPHDVTLPMVQELFRPVPFMPIIGHMGEFPRKPDPFTLQMIADNWKVTPDQLTLVGDSIIDARTAANAGSQCALVTWGYGQTRELHEWDAPTFGTVEELRTHLLNL